VLFISSDQMCTYFFSEHRVQPRALNCNQSFCSATNDFYLLSLALEKFDFNFGFDKTLIVNCALPIVILSQLTLVFYC